jgi:predicted nucleic acid-binding protein
VATSEGVLDAGPLIHLSELDALDALQGFSSLYVSPTVAEEVERYQPDALKYIGLTFVAASRIELTPGLLALGQALLLDRGELEGPALMQIHSSAIFFTDDSAARLAAEQMGYRTHGTIGLVIRMVRQGYREPDHVIKLLEEIPYRSTLHISKKLLDEVIQRLKKEWGYRE